VAHIPTLGLKACFFWRNDSGAFKTECGSFIRFGVMGAPGIIGCIGGTFAGVLFLSIDQRHRRAPKSKRAF
jgi:hypothetical protein